jgi:hypothetical protein
MAHLVEAAEAAAAARVPGAQADDETLRLRRQRASPAHRLDLDLSDVSVRGDYVKVDGRMLVYVSDDIRGNQRHVLFVGESRSAKTALFEQRRLHGSLKESSRA